jgi:RNA-directed DNA polymerase
MREVSSLAKTLNWSARAFAGKPRDSRNGGDAKKHPPNLDGPNFVITQRDRLAMKKIKAHSLTGRITNRLMRQAFQAVKRNRGAAGVDKVSIRMFDANLEENLTALMQELKTGTFRPLPLRRVHIPKGPGTTKLRPLGIPVVRDRVAQEVIRRLLAPIFEPQFHDNSYGFIPGRNCHQAVERVLELHRQGLLVVLDADIQGFFDNLSHRVIMAAVATEVADGNILRLVEQFLTAGVMEDGVFKPTTIGTPQGGVISPLLANIVLNRLDWQLHQAGYRFVRYADDFVVLCQDRPQAQEALVSVRRVLEGELGLTLSPEKTKVTTYGKGYDFLGFRLSSRSRRMRDKSVQKFKAKVREVTERHRNFDQIVIVKLNQVIRGTANYFATSFSTCRWMFQKLDSWIRMRMRAMKLKRKNYNDNRKLRGGYFRRQLGLLTLEEFCKYQDRHGQVRRVIPRNGATSVGVAR